ncbi:MAG: hypothetical protein O0X93_07065 [Methanocorpusculum sp.]|nr:hypothetical protein [Methanocorpusculum sp.]MDE2523933.1 hypothetical protein [Methanocorpusculum sp.]
MLDKSMKIVILILIVVSVAFVSLWVASVYMDVDELSIVSHGIHVSPDNESALIEKMEQLAEESYRYWINTDRTGVNENKLFGTVITIKYREPIGITWIEDLGIAEISPRSIPVVVDKITAVIPDDPNGDFRLIVYRPSLDPERYNPDRYIFVISREQANELLKLAGLPIVSSDD